MLLRFLSFLLVLPTLLACGPSVTPKPGEVRAVAEGKPLPEPPGAVEIAPRDEVHSASPVVVTSDDPSWGNADALVTIVGFLDFQCPFCARVQNTLAEIRSSYSPSQVRYVWKSNPLPFHEQARPAHDAAVAVHRLGGDEAFFAFHDLVYQHRNELRPDNFRSWAEQVGVERARLEDELENPEVAAKVDRDMAQARQLGITGTPAFRVNGLVLSGAQPLEKFVSLIDEQLDEAAKELGTGTSRARVSLELTLRNFVEPELAKDAARTPSPPAPDTTVHKIVVEADDPIRGKKDALVTIVEWGNFQCPFCKRVEPTLRQVLEKYPTDVRLVWKDNPLPFHAQAKPAAEFARYVAKWRGKDAFWKVHDELFERQRELGEPLFEELAKARGLDWAKVEASIARGEFARAIEREQETGSDFNARGTPHFFINGRRLSGAQPFDAFDALIQEQLELARNLVESGVPRSRVYEKILETAEPAPGPERREAPALTQQLPSRGPGRARVVIQEFGDFQCPFCQRVQPTLDALRKQYPKDVRIVFRHLPLPFHREARLAAEASIEAQAQKGHDGFFAYHDLLYANQEALGRADLERYAAQLGLDMTRFRKALDEGTHAARVEADLAAAREANVRGTPGFFINDYFLSGAQPSAQFERLIERELDAKAKPH